MNTFSKPMQPQSMGMSEGGGPVNITKEQVEKAVMDALNSLYAAEAPKEEPADPEVDAVMGQMTKKY